MQQTSVYAKFLRSSIILIAVLIFIIGSVIYYISKKTATQIQTHRANTLIQQTAQEFSGSMSLIKMHANGTIVVRAKADSKKNPITGFDVMIHYNHSLFKLAKVEGLMSGFDYYDTDEQIDPTTSELIVTAVRSIGNEDQNVFKDTDIVEITFTRLKRADKEILDLVFVPGDVRYSNMIDSQSRNILGNAKDLDLKNTL